MFDKALIGKLPRIRVDFAKSLHMAQSFLVNYNASEETYAELPNSNRLTASQCQQQLVRQSSHIGVQLAHEAAEIVMFEKLRQ